MSEQPQPSSAAVELTLRNATTRQIIAELQRLVDAGYGSARPSFNVFPGVKSIVVEVERDLDPMDAAVAAMVKSATAPKGGAK